MFINCETDTGTKLCIVSNYKDITSDIMLMVLKSGLKDFEFTSNWTEESAKYEEDVMKLIHEYIHNVEIKMPSVDVLRCANRGLEALMSIREKEALKRSVELWDDAVNKETTMSFSEKLNVDVINDAASEMLFNVNELVYKANFEEMWKDLRASRKNELCKEWGMTLGIAAEDKPLGDIAHTKRELFTFEFVMGREFEEFDQYLRA